MAITACIYVLEYMAPNYTCCISLVKSFKLRQPVPLSGNTPVFLPGESQARGSLVGCRLWGHTDLDTIEVI